MTAAERSIFSESESTVDYVFMKNCFHFIVLYLISYTHKLIFHDKRSLTNIVLSQLIYNNIKMSTLNIV